MPDFLKIVSALKEQMSANLSRSDVLRPLSWLLGITLVSFIICLGEKAPTWASIILSVTLLAEVSLYIGAYIFCLVKDRDALRSEKYSLNKMAIEHGMYGDSQIGLFDNQPLLDAPSHTLIGNQADEPVLKKDEERQ